MQFLAAATLFGLALAAPTPQTTDCPNPAHCGGSPPDPSTYENIDISDFYLRKNPGITAASFTLSPQGASNVSCSIGTVESLPSEVQACGDSKYRFGLIEGNEVPEVGVRLYKELGTAVGFTGEGPIPTYCHAGGDGPQDFVCSQVAFVTIVVS